ncbi:MAG TPA: hypothetical protein VGD59_15715 [Acidisarcina sp.]
MPQRDHQRVIRIWLGLFIAGLVLSGVTAFPLQTELRWMLAALEAPALRPVAQSARLLPWIVRVNDALSDTAKRYPFLAYGTDWLAYAHLAIAVAFVGPYRDPVRNKWTITFGLIACAGVVPLALIAGQFRGIPFGWRLVDCCFGVFGALPLLLCMRHVAALELSRAPKS